MNGGFCGVIRNLVLIFSAMMVNSAAHAMDWPCQGVVDLTVNHENYQIPVDIAQTDEERGRGLMFRQSLDGAGMLFVYPDEKLRAFWMKNTPLSLDILFLAKAGESRVLHQAVQPFQTAPPYPSGLASLVLEVEAGAIEWGGEGRLTNEGANAGMLENLETMVFQFSTTSQACADFVKNHDLHVVPPSP